MNKIAKLALGALLLALVALPLGAQNLVALDQKYGVPSQPAYIKHYEADKTGKVILNPYLQVATKEFPAILDVKMAPYNWVIDLDGWAGNFAQVRFRATSDGSVASSGWYIDEVEVWKGMPSLSSPDGFEAGWGDWNADC